MGRSVPKLLLVSQLVDPLGAAEEILARLDEDRVAAGSPTLLQGVLVMAVAALEVALVDSLKYYLQHFPEKLPSEDLHVSVQSLPLDTMELLASMADRRVVALAYKPFGEFLQRYSKTLSLSDGAYTSLVAASAQEVKATRNLILHNGLTANEFYLAQAGPARRAERCGQKLLVDEPYVAGAIASLSELLRQLTEATWEKYGTYTKAAAHRQLWDYLFDSPVLGYDDYWVVDEAADRIVASKRGPHEGDISNSERMFLGLWRAHFNGDGEYLAKFNMRSFDSSNQRKVLFFLGIARAFPWS